MIEFLHIYNRFSLIQFGLEFINRKSNQTGWFFQNKTKFNQFFFSIFNFFGSVLIADLFGNYWGGLFRVCIKVVKEVVYS